MLSVHNPSLGSRVVPTWGRPPSSHRRSEALIRATRTRTLDLHPRLSPWHLLTFRFLAVVFFSWQQCRKEALLPAASCCHKTRTTCLKLGPTAMSHYHNGLISWRLIKAFSGLFQRSFHGSGWLDGDTADEISRPSMQFFRRRKSTPRCVLLLCLINQPAIDLWSTFHGPVLHSRTHAAAETRSGWHGAEAAAPSCRCADKKNFGGRVRHSLVMTLWMLSALFHACPNTEGQFEEPRGGISPKYAGTDGDTHRWSEPRRIKGGERNKLSLISPSLSHVDFIRRLSCNSFVSLSWSLTPSPFQLLQQL